MSNIEFIPSPGKLRDRRSPEAKRLAAMLAQAILASAQPDEIRRISAALDAALNKIGENNR